MPLLGKVPQCLLFLNLTLAITTSFSYYTIYCNKNNLWVIQKICFCFVMSKNKRRSSYFKLLAHYYLNPLNFVKWCIIALHFAKSLWNFNYFTRCNCLIRIAHILQLRFRSMDLMRFTIQETERRSNERELSVDN